MALGKEATFARRGPGVLSVSAGSPVPRRVMLALQFRTLGQAKPATLGRRWNTMWQYPDAAWALCRVQST